MMPRNSRSFSRAPDGKSWETPPGLMYAWFIRSPVISSKMSSTFSRSRMPYRKTVVAPTSRPNVPTAVRCEAIRLSSIISTRITLARSGTWSVMPSSRSMARQYAVSLNSGDR